MRSGKAGNTEFNFAAGFVNLPLAEPGEFTFKAVHLSKAGPIQIIIEHGTGLDGAPFKSPVPVIGFWAVRKSCVIWPKPGFGLSGANKR